MRSPMEDLPFLISGWLERTNSRLEALNALQERKLGLERPERDQVEHELVDLRTVLEELYQEASNILYTSVIRIGRDPNGISENPVPFYLALYAMEMTTAYGEYRERPHNSLQGMAASMEKVRGAFAGEYRYRPIRSIDDLGIGEDLQKVLFLYNGVLTVGELEAALNANQSIRGFGAAKLERCRTGMERWRARKSAGREGPRPLDRASLEGLGVGLWRMNSGASRSYYIELNPLQVIHVNGEISLATFSDGSGLALARLAQI